MTITSVLPTRIVVMGVLPSYPLLFGSNGGGSQPPTVDIAWDPDLASLIGTAPGEIAHLWDFSAVSVDQTATITVVPDTGGDTAHDLDTIFVGTPTIDYGRRAIIMDSGNFTMGTPLSASGYTWFFLYSRTVAQAPMPIRNSVTGTFIQSGKSGNFNFKHNGDHVHSVGDIPELGFSYRPNVVEVAVTDAGCDLTVDGDNKGVMAVNFSTALFDRIPGAYIDGYMIAALAVVNGGTTDQLNLVRQWIASRGGVTLVERAATQVGLLISGQSNAQNLGENPASDQVQIGLASSLSRFTGEGVETINGAVAATRLLQGTGFAAAGWWNVDTNSPGTYLTALDVSINAGTSTPRINLWCQGESDANTPAEWDRVVYKTALNALLDYIKETHGVNTALWVPGRRTGPAVGNETQELREVQWEVIAENPNVADGMDIYDLPLFDEVHLTNAGYGVMAQRGCASIEGEGVQAPVIASAVRSAGAQTVVVSLTTSRADASGWSVNWNTVTGSTNNILPVSGTHQIQIYDATGALTPTAMNFDVTAGTVTLTYAGGTFDGTEPLRAFIAEGPTAALDLATIIRDNHTRLKLPLRTGPHTSV